MTTAASDALTAERDDLARRAQRGIGMPIAGGLYWLAVAWLLRTYPPGQALVYGFFLTGAVFPVGWGLTRALGGDLMAKSPALTPLGMQLNFLQLCFWPVLIVVWREAQPWTPYVMGVLFGSHFLPYSWFYRSRGYMTLTLLLTIVLTAAVVMAGDPLFHTVPLLAAGCYAIAVAMLMQENRVRA